ncbi:MAG: PH domain-containing protein [Flavobacteriia bacterium]|nr:PH domain-containing protein [Flavobacteriia bacterium]
MDYTLPQRLAPIALLRVFLRVIRFMLSNLWPLLVVYFLRVNRRSEAGFENDNFIYIIYGVLGLTVISGLIRYFTFRWQVDGDALIIRYGVIRKVDLRIPFERIQAIDLQQPWYYQLGNAARFVVDTAGSKSNEAEIWALKMAEAEALRSYIHEKKAEIDAESSPEEERTEVAVPTEEVEWVRVDISTLIKIGLFRNHLRSIAAFIGGAFYLYSQLQEFLEADEINNQIAEFAQGVPMVLSIFVILAVLVVVAAVLFSVGVTIFRFFGFNIVERNGALVARYGLTSVKTRQIRPSKIQILRTEQGPVFKALKILKFKIEQAYAEKVRNKDDFSIPGSPQQMVMALRTRIFGEMPNMVHTGASFKWFWYRVTRIGLLPLIVPIGVGYYLDDHVWFLAWFWLLLQAGYSYLLWKNQGIAIDDEVLAVRKQVVFDKRAVLQLSRVQAVEQQRSWFQRRRGLCTLNIETAGGSVSLPYISDEVADKLSNYLLYKSETAKLDWM